MRLLLLSLFLSGALNSQESPEKGPIQVDDRFESGSLGKWRIENNTELRFIPRTDYDQDRVNTAVTWFYGKLANVLNREITIVIEGLQYTVYNGKLGTIYPFERGTVPVFSYDGRHWERFSNCSFSKNSREFRIYQIFSHDEVWIAYIPPYSVSDLDSLLFDIRVNPFVKVESIGRSVQGRPIQLVTVTEVDPEVGNSPVVWIVARQHSFEAGGSWAIEGLLRFLVSDQDEARAIRNSMTLKICPMVNPDGVFGGGTRFNALGVDLNRHWHRSDPLSADPVKAPEIHYVKNAVYLWSEKHRLDLFINIHNNDMVWNEDGDYINYAPAQLTDQAEQLENLLRKHSIFTGPFELSENELATESVVANETGALSLLLEMKTGFIESLDRWTGADLFMLQGRGIARALARLFEPGEEPE